MRIVIDPMPLPSLTVAKQMDKLLRWYRDINTHRYLHVRFTNGRRRNLDVYFSRYHILPGPVWANEVKAAKFPHTMLVLQHVEAVPTHIGMFKQFLRVLEEKLSGELLLVQLVHNVKFRTFLLSKGFVPHDQGLSVVKYYQAKNN